MDLGFERCGFRTMVAFDIIKICGDTLRHNLPCCDVYSGQDGDVVNIDFTQYKNHIDVVIGGPPCQPFSSLGRGDGNKDDRDMWPHFIRAVLSIRPVAFVAENVTSLVHNHKFHAYFRSILDELNLTYKTSFFIANTHKFGVPQDRSRLFIVGVIRDRNLPSFNIPIGDYSTELDLFVSDKTTYKARECLGLTNIGVERIAPTITANGFTGKTPSIGSASGSLNIWRKLKICPSGVKMTREEADREPDLIRGHYRLSVPEVAYLQGFSDDWEIKGTVCDRLGQIGNSVSPVVAYRIAEQIATCLL